ncbi:MAG: hypothetical protein ACI9EA_001369, partial [Pseudomonadales bacterium]
GKARTAENSTNMKFFNIIVFGLGKLVNGIFDPNLN